MYPAAVSPLQPGAPSPNLLMQDMARYFLSFRIVGRQNDGYSRLLGGLFDNGKLDSCRFATLNYEHLLEQAMVLGNLPPAVIRPHGSCQMWPGHGGQIRWGGNRAMGQGFNSISPRIRRHSREESTALLDRPGQGMYPCMALYIPSKVTQMAQRYLRRAQAKFRLVAAEADVIAVVGARPWAPDTHIWPVLSSSAGRVCYVGSPADFSNLRSMRASRPTEYIGEFFLDSMSDLIAKV